MPAQDKFNAGEKLMFWAMSICLLLMALSGLVMWRAYFTFPVTAGTPGRRDSRCRGSDNDRPHHRPYLCGDLDQGNDPRHDVRHGEPRLGQAAPCDLVSPDDGRLTMTITRFRSDDHKQPGVLPRSLILPDPSRIFLDRSRRFATLAEGHSLADWLSFLGRLTEAQHEAAAGISTPSRCRMTQPWRLPGNIACRPFRPHPGRAILPGGKH